MQEETILITNTKNVDKHWNPIHDLYNELEFAQRSVNASIDMIEEYWDRDIDDRYINLSELRAEIEEVEELSKNALRRLQSVENLVEE
jgi:hypothetical protein